MTTIKEKKKILIVSRSNDIVARYIKQWLIATDTDFVNLDYDRGLFSITSLDVNSLDFKFTIDETEYDINNFQSIYFHKGALQLKDYTGVEESLKNVKDANSAFNYYRMAYETSIREISEFLMNNHNTIGENNGGRINKLRMLSIAHQVGLKTPKTLVTTKKTELEAFFHENQQIITKCLDINMIFYDKKSNKLLHALTSSITKDDLELLPISFPLSVFQENIPKLLELRVFFVGDTNFASAIFSQTSNTTQQDYRNYDLDYPNRITSFTLPDDIIDKLNHFKKVANIQTGSFDLILTPNDEYVFLEINPQGQFMAISDYCNYYLEKKIVDYLISY